MISYIKGKIISKKDKEIIVLSSDIGYRVFLSKKNIERVEEKKEFSLFTFLEVRENALNLYGFLEEEEFLLFERLKEIRGIGLKAALEISSLYTISSLREKIEEGNEDIFKGIPGIGKKKALTILFQLKEKTENISKNEDELLSSLTALGFPTLKTKKIISKIDFKGKSEEEKIKIALKKIKEEGI